MSNEGDTRPSDPSDEWITKVCVEVQRASDELAACRLRRDRVLRAAKRRRTIDEIVQLTGGTLERAMVGRITGGSE